MAVNIDTSNIGENDNQTYYSGTVTTSQEYIYARPQDNFLFQNTGSAPLLIEIGNGKINLDPGETEGTNTVASKFKVVGASTFRVLSQNHINVNDAIKDLYASGGGGGGGINETAVNALIDAKIAPLTNPVTASLTITGTTPALSNNALEVGQTLTAVNFSWSIGNYTNAKSARIYNISGSASVTSITPAASGTYNATGLSIVKSSPGTQQYRLEVTDKNDKVTNSSTQTINWYYPVFYGSSSSATLDATGITGLANRRPQVNMNGTYAFTGGGTNYKYICIPALFTTVNMFDNATGFAFPLTEQAGGNIDVDVNGVTVAYKVLRSNNQIGDATARN
jgi:hypothetical protein